MLRSSTFMLSLATIALCPFTPNPASAAPPRYSVTDLSSQVGSLGFTPIDINNYGQVIGSRFSGNVHAVLWTPSKPNGTVGSVTRLEAWAYPTAINDYGQVAGFAGDAVLWSPSKPNGTDGTTMNLLTLGSGPDSYSMAINNAGQVVGYSSIDPTRSVFRSFLWTPAQPNGNAGTMLAMGTMDTTATFEWPVSINRNGQVLAWSFTPEHKKTFLWTPTEPNGASGTFADLSDLPAAAELWGTRISDTGQIVGSALFGRARHALLWTPSAPGQSSGVALDLGALPNPLDSSEAFDANPLGQVVGWSYLDTGWHAFLWTSAFGMLDLNTCLDPTGGPWELERAVAINDRGQIVAWAYDGPDHSDTQRHMLLLTPVPEPAAPFLLLATVSLLTRRRIQRN